MQSAGNFSQLLSDLSEVTEMFQDKAMIHTVFWPFLPQVLNILSMMLVVFMMIWFCSKHKSSHDKIPVCALKISAWKVHALQNNAWTFQSNNGKKTTVYFERMQLNEDSS